MRFQVKTGIPGIIILSGLIRLSLVEMLTIVYGVSIVISGVADLMITGSLIQTVLLIFVLFSSVLLFTASLRWKKEETTE